MGFLRPTKEPKTTKWRGHRRRDGQQNQAGDLWHPGENTVKDAYLVGEYYLQQGDVTGGETGKKKLGGEAYSIGLGGTTNNSKFGRFGATADYWSVQATSPAPKGMTKPFGPPSPAAGRAWREKATANISRPPIPMSTLPVLPSPPRIPPMTACRREPPASKPFISASTHAWPQWSFEFDYYQYKAQKNLSGEKEWERNSIMV